KLTSKGPGSFVFASDRSRQGHLGENTLRAALHELGFEVTAHGFRSTLTDLLNLNHFSVDAIERQLDHVLGHISGKKGAVRNVYLRTDFLDYRRTMMQWLGDWADAQKAERKTPALPPNVIQLYGYAA